MAVLYDGEILLQLSAEGKILLTKEYLIMKNSKVSLQDCINPFNNNSSKSEHVVIDSERNSGNRAASFNLAYEGGFLEHIGDGLYKCKRIVADNLSLVILSDYPVIIK